MIDEPSPTLLDKLVAASLLLIAVIGLTVGGYIFGAHDTCKHLIPGATDYDPVVEQCVSTVIADKFGGKGGPYGSPHRR